MKSMIHRLAGTIALVSVLAAACDGETVGGTTTSTPSTSTSTTGATTTTILDENCSAQAQGLSAGQVDGLPTAVAVARLAVIAAARACDYAELDRLASTGGREFTYSFGEDGDPGGHWRTLEEEGEEVLADLVRILNMSYRQNDIQLEAGIGTPIYFWPAAFGDGATDEDWAEVAGIYTNEEITEMKEFGGYTGWRAGFTEDGEWLFFVSGD